MRKCLKLSDHLFFLGVCRKTNFDDMGRYQKLPTKILSRFVTKLFFYDVSKIKKIHKIFVSEIVRQHEERQHEESSEIVRQCEERQHDESSEIQSENDERHECFGQS